MITIFILFMYVSNKRMYMFIYYLILTVRLILSSTKRKISKKEKNIWKTWSYEIMLLVLCKILRTNLCYDFKRNGAKDDGDSDPTRHLWNKKS